MSSVEVVIVLSTLVVRDDGSQYLRVRKVGALIEESEVPYELGMYVNDLPFVRMSLARNDS